MTRYVHIRAPHYIWADDWPEDCPPPAPYYHYRREVVVVPPHVVRKVVVSPPPRVEVASPDLPPCTLRGGVNTDWASNTCAALHEGAAEAILPARPIHPAQTPPPPSSALQPSPTPQASLAPQPPPAPASSPTPQAAPVPQAAPAPQVSTQPPSAAPKLTAQVGQPADQPARHSSLPADIGWGFALLVAFLLLRGPVLRTVAAARAWSARESERREAAQLSAMSSEEFASSMARHEEAIDELSRRGQQLSEGANEMLASHFFARWRSERMRRRAAQYAERVAAKRAEVARLRARWDEIEAARSDPGQTVKDKSVHELLDLLGSDDDTANRALLQLYGRGGWLKWEDMIPPELPADARAKLVKICRVINGTLSLGEARAALAQARRMLKLHNIDWERMAA